MADTPKVRAATTSELERAIATITCAFAADPFTRWVWPDAADFLGHFPLVLREFGVHAAANESVYVTEDFGGAALWIPPGVHPNEPALVAIIERSVRGARKDEFLEVFGLMGSYHPEDPHWYLPMIGVDPSRQNQGNGGAILQHALARCDREGLPAYLESSNPMNITLYQRHGFEIMGEIRVADSPLMTPMLRPPR
ncbi:MAG TPA: GNAT family N-acetyltransferase [Myxococcota bacterium]|nr:GNAT family N-acetyltransferase [Myxococcota bacterium]